MNDIVKNTTFFEKAKILCYNFKFRVEVTQKRHLDKRTIKKIRNSKNPIQVIFVLYDLASWKSEDLYLSMLSHRRFNPILAVTKNYNLVGHEAGVIEYLKVKGYDYVFLDPEKRIVEQINVDILIYQRPYCEFSPLHYWRENKKAILLRLGYGFHSLLEPWLLNNELSVIAWQDYYENDINIDDCRRVTKKRRNNLVLTGIPFMDKLALPKECFPNPWKNTDSRKRIIWAPHHTIGNLHMEGIAYGTFLEVADDMLAIAKEYADSVFWAFKPHPQLKKMLLKAGWSEERIDRYYSQWDNADFAQYKQGEYMGLFKHSDAMIHDCSSFIMEYISTGNPALYLLRPDHETGNINRTTQMSLKQHYIAHDTHDIRNFVESIIAGEDPRKKERNQFVQRYLRPPHGKTACENIMNAILGAEEYSNC